MKTISFCLLGLVAFSFVGSAYPPAPDHTFSGLIRNEWGDPLDLQDARIYIQSTNGVGVNAAIAPSTQPGMNYRLIVPMDSARSPKIEPPSPSSLQQNQGFQLKVVIGTTIYLPIEMVFSRPLGEPAGNTRLDLTLGLDSDGDGLPDAWELANGLNPNNPNDAHGDADGDGLSNRDEYLAGTYAFDANDGFRLTLTGVNNGNSTLEFLAIRGRNYRIQTSPNLTTWAPVDFRVIHGGVPGPVQSNYQATDVRTLQIEVPFQSGATNRYFKAVVQ
jgi:hypothetical protein